MCCFIYLFWCVWFSVNADTVWPIDESWRWPIYKTLSLSEGKTRSNRQSVVYGNDTDPEPTVLNGNRIENFRSLLPNGEDLLRCACTRAFNETQMNAIDAWLNRTSSALASMCKLYRVEVVSSISGISGTVSGSWSVRNVTLEVTHETVECSIGIESKPCWVVLLQKMATGVWHRVVSTPVSDAAAQTIVVDQRGCVIGSKGFGFVVVFGPSALKCDRLSTAGAYVLATRWKPAGGVSGAWRCDIWTCEESRVNTSERTAGYPTDPVIHSTVSYLAPVRSPQARSVAVRASLWTLVTVSAVGVGFYAVWQLFIMPHRLTYSAPSGSPIDRSL
ncbi:t17 [Tupaiid betaherpesvirus 1]|uniref:T17 n=1 Tax=Tupaiid herpesvirus 1 (strain 1) TaxID=10397 RepID=Q91TU4_TUHV1|nr:t17 [Tupaiid betaherpesvirus 1]AAK57043.1 t17 [Tupaiid betaherpesvirus 1]